MIALARGAKPFHHLITNLFTPDRLPGPFKRHRKRKKTIYFKKLQVQRYRFEIYFFWEIMSLGCVRSESLTRTVVPSWYWDISYDSYHYTYLGRVENFNWNICFGGFYRPRTLVWKTRLFSKKIIRPGI